MDEMPSELVIDGQVMTHMSQQWLLSHCFACANDDSWSAFEKRFVQHGERQASQTGPINSILRTSGRFVIRAMSPECEATALQVSRNMFQYFAADTEIISPETIPNGNLTSIAVESGEHVGWVNQKPQTIKVIETQGVSIGRDDDTHRLYGFEEGMGIVSLSRRRMPDFIVVRKRCAWEGAAGVLAMGSFNKSWEASEGSFIT
ncbi:MAG: hypothetical protein Q9163_005077 [Psora crenata]